VALPVKQIAVWNAWAPELKNKPRLPLKKRSHTPPNTIPDSSPTAEPWAGYEFGPGEDSAADMYITSMVVPAPRAHAVPVPPPPHSRPGTQGSERAFRIRRSGTPRSEEQHDLALLQHFRLVASADDSEQTPVAAAAAGEPCALLSAPPPALAPPSPLGGSSGHDPTTSPPQAALPLLSAPGDSALRRRPVSSYHPRTVRRPRARPAPGPARPRVTRRGAPARRRSERRRQSRSLRRRGSCLPRRVPRRRARARRPAPRCRARARAAPRPRARRARASPRWRGGAFPGTARRAARCCKAGAIRTRTTRTRRRTRRVRLVREEGRDVSS